MRKNWILYIFLFLLLVAMLHESFWTEMFSVVKFLLILLAIFLIPLIVRFIVFMILLIKNFRTIRNGSQNPFSFYSRTYSAHPNSNGSRYGYRFNPFSYRTRKDYSSNNNGSMNNSSRVNQSRVIEICPKCGYEKGENHICTNKN